MCSISLPLSSFFFFSILFGGVVLVLAIAFGVGGIDAAKRVIEQGSEEKKKEDN